MAILCPDLNLLFVQVPSTGCSVIGRVLREQFGGVYKPEKSVIRDGKVVVQRKHNTVAEMLEHGVITEDELQGLLVVATMRNPLDRFVTFFQRRVGPWVEEYAAWAQRDLDRRRDTLTDEQYADALVRLERKRKREEKRARTLRRVGFDVWFLRTLAQERWKKSGDLMRRSYPMLDHVDVVLRYERLEEGLNEVLKALGVQEPVALPVRNVTPGKKPFASYYSPLSKLAARRLMGRELDAFAYGFTPNGQAPPYVVLSDKPLAQRLLPSSSSASA